MTDQSASPTRPPAPAKVKILSIADGLFYDEGVHAVGVDRIIAQSHVTKATFYKHYRSKDILVAAFVAGRAAKERDAVASDRERFGDAVRVLRGIADRAAEQSRRPGYHGCPFINAAASQIAQDGPVEPAVREWRVWLRATLVELFTEAGAFAPQDAADDLLLARDGAFGGGRVADPDAVGPALRRALDRLVA